MAAASWDPVAGAGAAGDTPPLTLHLTTGEAVRVDVVIAATGVVPAVELAVDAGIAVDGQGAGGGVGGGGGAVPPGRVAAAKAGGLTSPAPPAWPAPMTEAAAVAAAAAESSSPPTTHPPVPPPPPPPSTLSPTPLPPSSHPCPGGILVRAPSMATSAPGVYAAGDCTTVVTPAVPPGAPPPLWHQMRLWGQARVAGVAAARSAARAAARHVAAVAAAAAGAAAAKQARGEEGEHGGNNGTAAAATAADPASVFKGAVANVQDDGHEDNSDEDDDADLSFELFAHVTWFMGAKVVLLGRHDGRGLPPGYTVYEADGSEGGEGGPGSWARAVVSASGRLVGGVLVGETGLEEAYENLMLDGLDVGGVGGALVAGGGVDLADYYD